MPDTEDSLYVNTGYSGDSETTVSQTPAPVRDYANAVVTGSYMNQTPGPAYRLRSMTRGLTKPRYILNELMNIVKDDIKEDDKAIKDRKDKADEVFTLVGVGEEDSVCNQSAYYKTSEDIEVDKGKRVQFNDVLKSLDTSIGAILKIEAIDEQEKKLESFKAAAEAVNINVRKVKDKGNWKEEEDMRSPEETNEAAALRSLTSS